jgi:5-methylcytosine-specific restriction endonuclease McrA
MNRWNIPGWLEREILERDKTCIYCGVVFEPPNARVGLRPSWEHIVNDARIITRENIARCCRSCNASKGAKPLSVWFESRYCKERGIDLETVAEIVRNTWIGR